MLLVFKGLIFLHFLHSLFSLQSSDLCNRVQKECRGQYDLNLNYQIKCESISCHGRYSYECNDKCATDETTCYNYETFRISNQRNRADIFSILNSFHTNGYKSGKDKLKNFEQNILSCPERSYEFKLNHICLKGKDCYEKIKQFRNFKSHYIYRKVKCLCSSIYNYECHDLYCSTNQQSCDYFKNITIEAKTKQALNKCGNNTKINQKISFASRMIFI